jgi:hypothetical protein
VPAERPANGRPRHQQATRGLHKRSPGRTGLSGAPRGRWLQRLAAPKKEEDRALFIVRCAPDCSVHPRIEGNLGLPKWTPTAPTYLGAIKGTPRNMEQHTKNPLNFLQCRDFAITDLFHCDKDSSTSLSCDFAVLFRVLVS